MLKLDKLNISGFKSFSDRTEVRFPQGITAVVGPNGCGKSNIGDAINWVLGEQSPKLLRGKQMTDVIFSGSAARKAQGLAEVSLLFSGAEGLPHSDGGKITLTRKLFRSGDSEYLLNGARARLKDIQELLREARIGTKTYSKIEQGRIDQVLNAKPKERRLMIEDAAGIAGYKHKRRLTEMKLEATEANLLRVNDIVTEVTRQINSVKRQASKARRYKDLREELREQDGIRFAARAEHLRKTLAALRQKEADARDAESAAAAGLGKLEVNLVDRRTELETSQRTFREAAEALHRLELEIDREEAQIRTHKERMQESEAAAKATAEDLDLLRGRLEESKRGSGEHAKLVEESTAEYRQLEESAESEHQVLRQAETALAQRREELEQARKQQFESMQQAAEKRNRLRSMQEMLDREAQQRARIETEQQTAQNDWTRHEDEAARLAEATRDVGRRLESLEQRFQDDEAALTAAKGRLNDLTEQLSEAREHERSAQARLATLEDLATRFAGVSDGVRTLLSKGASRGVRTCGVVADFVEAGAQVERAAEGYLTELLPVVVLEDDGDVSRAASMLRDEGAGRTSFLSRTQPAGAFAVGSSSNGKGLLPPELMNDRRVRGKLSDNLKLNSRLNGALEHRIGDAVLVDSLESALELHRSHPQADYLTEEGDVVYASGVIAVGGKREGDRGLLAHNRRIQEVRAEMDSGVDRVRDLESQRNAALERVEELEQKVRDGRQELESLRSRQLELRLQAEQSQEQKAQSGRRKDVLGDELAALVEQAVRLGVEIEGLTQSVSQSEHLHEQAATSLDACRLAAEEAETDARKQAEKVNLLRQDLAARGQQVQALEQDRRRLDESLKELAARIESVETQRTAALARVEESKGIVESTHESLIGHLEQRDKQRGENEATERKIAEIGRELSQHEERLRGDRGSLDSLREATRLAELETARADSDREHLEEMCLQDIDMTPEEAIEAAGEALESVDLAQLEARVAGIKGKIERLGPVNMTAIEEFSELEERHTFLTSQREDLQQSMASLRETIRKVNRQSREKFVEAFDQIRASYQEIYKLLFNGGRADLRLEEGEDVLDCGIEILAQPPGKRLAGVHLLSGGEKALSAIALLFAIFRYSPSPFCMLDEVDAALDESNVGRFSRMLREYSQNTQFIMVTHNKVSMEQADLLYGVTMEEPGVSKLISMELG